MGKEVPGMGASQEEREYSFRKTEDFGMLEGGGRRNQSIQIGREGKEGRSNQGHGGL